ncbi:serine protease [Luteolibacter flavescens]|uniref:Serine protease n=1 Tax=Luteolibacter flavescens TaxID=1859460 RepID=A0ABT3FNJ5_9BACT|nr:serine protease [Luteolibacter flavescens]MCW1885137.1 serine protease [Luteolibacter flavescens]
MFRSIALALAATTTLVSASTAELRDTARKLSADHKDAIVWLSVLAKVSMSADGDVPAQLKAALAAQEKEEKSETTGTIIDSSGLIVTALGGLDKSSMVDGQTVPTPAGPIKLKSNSEIKEVKVIMADGSEIPADLVLKDSDLGLAFIKVRMDSEEAKGVELQSIDLADSAKGEVLDECIALGRLDESLNRESSLLTTEISGITTRPRTFYRVATDSVGCPVYLANGKLLGVSVLRSPKGAAARGGQIQISPIILPAADIAKVAAQAKEAKAVEPAATEEKAAEDKPAEDKAGE